MPNTRINCPNCRQPIMADIEQLFDTGGDPTAKQKLISGMSNIVQCPHCGFTGNLATPIVYHDPDKELLLTFVPGEVALKRDDQERIIGSLINQVVNRLPQEKRKGYLLQPKSFLTLQSLIERILEADGITREMIQAQQEKLNLMQRLLEASDEMFSQIVQQEDELIDAEFFALLNRLMEAASIQGDQDTARKLDQIQKSLLSSTTYGRELDQQMKEVEAALTSLREEGEQLTRDKLLDLVIKAPNETRLSALVSFARPGMDYEFFTMLSERIDRARGDGRNRLIELREQLLEMTKEIDLQMEARSKQARQVLNDILAAKDLNEAVMERMQMIDSFFVEELETMLDVARKQGDLEKSSKLGQVAQIIQQLSEAPPEIEFIQQLVDTADDQAQLQLLETNPEKVTPELLDALTNLVAQMANNQNAELTKRVRAVYSLVLRYSMQTNLRKIS